jgi:protein SCO1/2
MRCWQEVLASLRNVVLVMLVFAARVTSAADSRHAARGIILKVDPSQRSIVVSCETIPGYMNAMEMSFTVRDAKALRSLKQGEGIRFTIDSHGNQVFAEDIRTGVSLSNEAEPMKAEQLAELNQMLAPDVKTLAVGDEAPDFALTDQVGRQVHLRDFAGKVVLLTFGYSRCPNPNYCYRLSSNLAHVEKRFHEQAGRELVLTTIMLDPEHDQGETLSQFAGVWKADPERWHFLTGPLPEIKQAVAPYGMNFWHVDGLLTHPLHTVILDRQGRLVANLEGNQFTVRELGDLVESVMMR